MRDLCANPSRAEQLLGAHLAANLRRRLADLRAATSIEELPVNKPYAMDGSGRLAIDLAEGVRVVFASNHVKTPRTSAGEIDWPRVGRIKILQIEGVDDRI